MNRNQRIALIHTVKISIDDEMLVDKDIHGARIYMNEVDLYQVPKQLLKDMTSDYWVPYESPKIMQGGDPHLQCIFRDLDDGRVAVVVIRFVPMGVNEFDSQRNEIINRIDVNLLTELYK